MKKKVLTISLLFIFANQIKPAEPELSSLRPGRDNVLSTTDFLNAVTEALNAERIEAERIEAERIAEIMEAERIAEIMEAERIEAERIEKQS